ncbi:Titin-like 22 [Homarus americanus]|uniref:Titin-like 22 n=1 Tax=Homarus americanus TaxID=6706 RepID=A0A8J5N5V7_HOMAM|nr:Titin-like 22 [Homarus americanus]
MEQMCVPGFKALIHLATDNQVDLETVELESVEKAAFSKDIAKLSLQLKKGVQVNELMTMMKEGDFVALKRTEHQAKLLEVADRLESATVHKVLVQEARDRCDSNIGLKSVMRTIETGKESMEQVIMDVSKEFGPSSEPVKEIAAIGHLLQEGVRCDEVMTLVESGLLPSLKMPQAQVPLVSMVADKGHIGTICEVMVAESVKEIPKTKTKGAAARVSEVKELLKKAKTQCVDVKTFTSEMVPGVKAIMRMAQEDQVNIEEVVQKANLEHKLKEEVAKIGMMVKHGVLAQDVITLMEAGEFPLLMREEAQAQLLTVVEDFGFKALVNQVMTEQVEQAIQKTDKTIGVKTFIRMLEQANVNVEEIITEQFPKEFDIKEQEPISQEMAKVSVMLTEGVQAQEIISMVEAGELPHLNRPETQMPLINVVEGQGQSALIFQVLIEDSVRDIIQELPKVDVATISSVETLQSASSTKVEVKGTKSAAAVVTFTKSQIDCDSEPLGE